MNRVMTSAALFALFAAPCAAYVSGETPTQSQRQGQNQVQSQRQEQNQVQSQRQEQNQVQSQRQEQNQVQSQRQEQNQVQSQRQEQNQVQSQRQGQQNQKTESLVLENGAELHRELNEQTQSTAQTQSSEPTQAQNQAQTVVKKRRKNKTYGPNWQVGDYWIVETRNRQTQSAERRDERPARWRFEVIGMARVGGRDCYQTKITSAEKTNNAPQTYLWVDAQSGALVRVATLNFVRGQWIKRVKTFQSQGDKATSVFGTVPALPLDMPLFDEDGAKALGDEEAFYTAVDGDDADSTARSKSVGASTGFAYKVKTTTTRFEQTAAKSLGDSQEWGLAGAKGLDEAVEVKMDGGPRQARQIWTPNAPWAVYSANETTEARLIETNVGAQDRQDDERNEEKR